MKFASAPKIILDLAKIFIIENLTIYNYDENALKKQDMKESITWESVQIFLVYSADTIDNKQATSTS